MMKYVIKNNLPDGIIKPTGYFNRKSALNHFLGLINHLTTNGYEIKTYVRNERNNPLRGTIRVAVDGFYYYVEMYSL